MYEEIKRLMEHKMRSMNHIRIERIADGDNDSERDVSLISEHITSQLEHQVSEMYDDRDVLESAAQPHDADPVFGGLQTQRQLTRHFAERLLYTDSPMKTLEYTVPLGSRFFGPPYDLEWTKGNGFSFGGRKDGKATTIPTRNGFSAAGIGFYLTTNVPVLAAITPQGSYDWNWSAFGNLPFARSSGGMGITVYTNSQPQPTLSRQPVLWSISGMTVWSGQKGSGQIADAASPAFGLGTVPLAPALVNMVPDSRYLVWVWCWQTSRLEENDAFIAFMQFSMPFVTINAGPPILTH